MISRCSSRDTPVIYEIVNDAAQAYRGVIPAERWHDPYMPMAELEAEIAAGVQFWGCRKDRNLVAVMGLQDVQDVSLIRHAYTRTVERGHGWGSALLAHLKEQTDRRLLVGTWKAADWAVRFYEGRGFRLVGEREKVALLKKYWTVSEGQIRDSVVLVLG
jgi:GNAT superfamily N-acetyltransferase